MWKIWVRKAHRWVSMIFTVVVAGIFGAMGLGRAPAEWVYLLPLVPLAVLFGTGLCLFLLPYLPRRRGQHADG